MNTWATIGRALHGEQSCAMVSIVEARGSAPREAGARMVVLEDGSFAGTIGGGELEWRAIARARAALAKAAAGGNPPPVGLERMALGPDLGQCCGGSVRVLLEVFTPGRCAEVQALADAERAGLFVAEGRITERCVVRTVLNRDLPAGEGSLLAADGRLLERFGTRKQVVALIGAGHVGRSLIVALAPLDFHVVWIDPREGAFPSIVPGDVRVVVAAGAGGRAGRGARWRLRAGHVAQPCARLRRRPRRAAGKAVRPCRPDRLGVEEGPIQEPPAASGPGGRRYRAAGLSHRHRRYRVEAAGGHRRIGGRGPAAPQGRHGACGAQRGSLVPVTRSRRSHTCSGCPHRVMAGLVPAIHGLFAHRRQGTWMPGTGPGMTEGIQGPATPVRGG